MVDQKKKLTRLAVAIHEQLASQAMGFAQTWLPAATWDEKAQLEDGVGAPSTCPVLNATCHRILDWFPVIRLIPIPIPVI